MRPAGQAAGPPPARSRGKGWDAGPPTLTGVVLGAQPRVREQAGCAPLGGSPAPLLRRKPEKETQAPAAPAWEPAW